MIEEAETTDAIAILRALEDNWALVDDYPDADYLVCVNESRDLLEDFFPKKSLVERMERAGLIEDTDDGPGFDEPELVGFTPHVYLYVVTEEGKAWLSS